MGYGIYCEDLELLGMITSQIQSLEKSYLSEIQRFAIGAMAKKEQPEVE